MSFILCGAVGELRRAEATYAERVEAIAILQSNTYRSIETHTSRVMGDDSHHKSGTNVVEYHKAQELAR